MKVRALLFFGFVAVASSGCSSGESGQAGGAGGASGGAAGNGLGGLGGVAGSGGISGGPSCVDIQIGPSALSSPRQWVPQGEPIPGGLWVSGDDLHVAWMAFEWNGVPGSDTFARLVISSFNRVSGVVSQPTVHSLFPSGVTTNEAVVESFAGRSDGLFAVGYDYMDAGSRKQFATLGQAGVDALVGTFEIPVDGDPLQLGDQSAAGWDGEAFAMHAYGSPPQFTLHVARVSETGGTLLPFTQYGQTINVNYILDGHVTSTNPESGRTYVFDSLSENLLNGHLRTGESFTAGPKQIQAVGFATSTTANKAVVSSDEAGAWIGWIQIDDATSTSFNAVVQRVDLDGNPIENAAVFPTKVGAEFGDLGGVGEWALLSGGAQRVDVVAATGLSIYSLAISGGSVGAGTVLVDGSSAPELDARDFEITEAQGEKWVFFSEKRQGHIRLLRVVKAVDGCVYPAALGQPE